MRSKIIRALSKQCPFESEQIEARSFEIIDRLLTDLDQMRPEYYLIQRIVHTTGDPSMARDIRIHPQAVEAGTQALLAGRPIITDVKMVTAGITRSITSLLGCEVLCAIDEPAVLEAARKQRITRAAAAMLHLSSALPGAVVAIGNAPTALYALLDCLSNGLAPPALIIGTPVGFVGAAEAKAELIKYADPGIPYVTVEGTRGGSAVAAAAVNALLRLAASKRTETRE